MSAPSSCGDDAAAATSSRDLPGALSDAVETFAALPTVLVATDFDGVLAPLVLDPADSRPQPGTVDALRAMATMEGVVVAVASGRDLATLRALTGLGDEDGVVLIGSHGAESNVPLTAGAGAQTGSLSEAENAALRAANQAVETIAEELPGANVEYKPAGVVLHTRGMDESAATTATRAAVAIPEDVIGVHAMRGKSVVELSVLDVSKGAALGALSRSHAAEATLYLGDDVTDETVFTSARGEADVMIKVGDGDTAARHRLASCTEVPGLLAAVRERLQACHTPQQHS